MGTYKYKVIIETELGRAYLDYESDHLLTPEECRKLLKENVQDKFCVWMRLENKIIPDQFYKKICKLSYSYQIIHLGDFWKFHCKMEKCSRFFHVEGEIYEGIDKHGMIVRFNTLDKDKLGIIKNIRKVSDVEINNMHFCPYQQPIHLLPYFKNGDDLNNLPEYPEPIKDLNKIMKHEKFKGFSEIHNENGICHCPICKQ